jgi:two-component system sensor histidine kinase CssS
MKSLQAHIRNPFLILIVALLIVIMLLLNVAIRLYLNNGVKQELRDAKSVLGQIAVQQNETEPTLPLLQKLDRSLTFARLQDDIHILLYQKNGKLLYPAANELPDLPRTLHTISAARLSAMREDRVYSFFRASGRYFALPWRLSSGGTLLLVTPAASVNRIIRTVDSFLLIALALGILISIIAANAAARRIARPMTALCERMRAVGNGRFCEGTASAARANIREIDSLQDSASHMAARLEAYDGAQKTFLANASHELKTPLMSIQGYAEGIAGGVVPDAKQAAQVIVRESKRLNALVSELLTLSRMDTALGRELQPMNLNQILPEYEQRLLGAATKQQRRLTLRLPENGPVISADDELLYQAVMNVVSNCLRYAKAEVVISLSVNANEAILHISDDGDGIPEADLPHLFERFYKGKNGNFGLGLAIAYSAVTALGGRIEAGNDSGAVFTITLPLIQV